MTVLWILLITIAAAAAISAAYVMFGNIALSVAVHTIDDAGHALRRAAYDVADRSDRQWTKAAVGLVIVLIAAGAAIIDLGPAALIAAPGAAVAAGFSAHAAKRQRGLANEFCKLTGRTPAEASRRVVGYAAS